MTTNAMKTRKMKKDIVPPGVESPAMVPPSQP
jgi:hypothetical protein